jgi:Peptidase family M23
MATAFLIVWRHATLFGAALGMTTAAAQSIELKLPIDCEIGRSCVIQNYVDHDPSSNAKDYQCGTLTYDGHDGTDFRLPTLATQRAGVAVLAAADGQVLRVRNGVIDALQTTSVAPPADDRACGNGIVISHVDSWETQYCHLARDSVKVKPGVRVASGQQIGQVGLSGRTQFPHLHLTVRQQGSVVDPFAFGAPEGSCGEGVSLWNLPQRSALAYRERTVLNAGFAAGPVTSEQIESGEVGRDPLLATAPALTAFVRTIGLRKGDIQSLSISAPDGRLFAEHTEMPLDRGKAQYVLFVGNNRASTNWPAGVYQARYSVKNAGKIVLEEHFALSF